MHSILGSAGQLMNTESALRAISRRVRLFAVVQLSFMAIAGALSFCYLAFVDGRYPIDRLMHVIALSWLLPGAILFTACYAFALLLSLSAGDREDASGSSQVSRTRFSTHERFA